MKKYSSLNFRLFFGRAKYALLAILLLVGCTPAVAPGPDIDTANTSSILQAEQSLQNYYSALLERDYRSAASLFSSKVGIGRSELLRMWEDMDADGWRLLSYEVTDKKVFDENRIVFWVDIQQDSLEPAQLSTINVLHFERGEWLVANAALEMFDLDIKEKRQNQLAIDGGLIIQYVVGYEVVLFLSNHNDQAIAWGVEGETCARLFWDDYQVDATCQSPSLIIAPGQTGVAVKSVFMLDAFEHPELPKEMEILQFGLDAKVTDSPDEPWGYQFDLKTITY